MKKIILILSILLMAVSTRAQVNERLRNHKMPEKIENLFRYAESLGYTTNVRYDHYDIPSRRTSLRETITNEGKGILLLDSIRNTFMALNDEEGRDCYMYESHKDGIDSMNYKLTLDSVEIKERQVGYDTKTGKPRFRTHKYIPRRLTFHCVPLSEERSLVLLHYEYIDSVQSTQSAPLNKKAYWQIVKKVIKRHGLKGRPYYLYNDSTLHNHINDVGMGNLDPTCRIIEQKGYVYQVDTEAHLKETLDDLIEETLTYLDQYPLETYYTSNDTRWSGPGIMLYPSMKGTKSYERFTVDVMHYYRPELFWLVVRETDGDDFLPRNWEKVKRYKNGKVKYYRK